MARDTLPAFLACCLAFAGCRPNTDTGVRATPLKKEDVKKPGEPRPPGPPGQPEEAAAAAAADDEPAIPSAGADMPSRDEGQKAFNLGKALLRDGDFVGAEVQLKVAAAAGLEGADKMLLRARTEAKGEEAFTSARKKIEEKDFAGAKHDLRQVPPGTVVASKAKTLMGELDGMEVAAYKEMKEKASERLGLSPDAGEANKPEEMKP